MCHTPLCGGIGAKKDKAQGRGFEPRPMDVGHLAGPGEPVVQPATSLERQAGFVLANEKGGQAHGEEDGSCAKASRARVITSTQIAISRKEEA